jgi:hypothetical protein
MLTGGVEEGGFGLLVDEGGGVVGVPVVCVELVLCTEVLDVELSSPPPGRSSSSIVGMI